MFAPIGSPECYTNCTLRTSNPLIVYDLSPLKRVNSSWGPIIAIRRPYVSYYYINVCSRVADGVCRRNFTYGCTQQAIDGQQTLGTSMRYLNAKFDFVLNFSYYCCRNSKHNILKIVK